MDEETAREIEEIKTHVAELVASVRTLQSLALDHNADILSVFQILKGKTDV